MAGNAGPVLVIVIALVAIWYVGAYALNAPFQRDLDRRAEVDPHALEFVAATMSQPKPTLPAPHQVAADLYQTVFLAKPWTQCEPDLSRLGDALLDASRIRLRHAARHRHRRRDRAFARRLDRSLMPWIIASQTIPILADRADGDRGARLDRREGASCRRR